MNTYVDGFSKITLSNNNLRIVLTQNGPDKEQIEVGTLILPAGEAGRFVNGLAGALTKLEEQLKKQQEEKSGQADAQVQ